MKKILIEIGGKAFYYILKTYYSIVVIAIVIMFLSSCGATQYNVGTGQKMSKHCSGAWVNN